MRQNRVFAGSEKALDLEILLDPLGEKLHLSALFVNVRHGFGAKSEGFGQFKSRVAAFRAFSAWKATYRLILMAGALKITDAVTRIRIRPRVHERLMPVSRSDSEILASIPERIL